MNRFAAWALAGALGAASMATQAAYLTHINHLGNFTFTTPVTTVPIGENLFGDVETLFFDVSTAGTHVLSYSAECAVNAPAGNQGAWLDIDLVVNGQAVAPTASNQDAFCAADGSFGFDRWVRRSITVGLPLHAGQNTVQVRARLNGGAVGGWLGDSALAIYR